VSGAVQNKDGKFVRASPQSVSKAGAGADFGKSENLLAAEIWNRSGAEAYPIASFTYLIVRKDLKNVSNHEGAQNLADFLWWATHDGQRFAAELGYAPLAPELQSKIEPALKSLNYRGAALKVGK
jgi:phosphate transport system substrate-binding protein